MGMAQDVLQKLRENTFETRATGVAIPNVQEGSYVRVGIRGESDCATAEAAGGSAAKRESGVEREREHRVVRKTVQHHEEYVHVAPRILFRS